MVYVRLVPMKVCRNIFLDVEVNDYEETYSHSLLVPFPFGLSEG